MGSASSVIGSVFFFQADDGIRYSLSLVGSEMFLRDSSGRFRLYNASNTTINLEGNTTRDSYILGDLGTVSNTQLTLPTTPYL